MPSVTINHYENFPVASLLLPDHLRKPVAAIYAFARSADDFADEGDLAPQDRLRHLDGYRTELGRIERGEASADPIFQRLNQAIARYDLPLQLLRDLLDAFSQDVGKTRYADFAELMNYCRRSANPIGRLLLRLYQSETAEQLAWSDAICSSLQLINHWQDVAIDWKKGSNGRLYLPLEDMARFGVSEAQITASVADDNWRALMRFQVDRARAMMLSGEPLGRALPGRIGLELRMIIAGGLRILDKIEAVGYDVFRRRPVLKPYDWPLLAWRAITR